MKSHKLFDRCIAQLLALSLLLSLTACGGNNTTAATMHLRRTEGTVSVSDGGGKDVPVLNNLGLYSGYGVGTRSDSYAWIDLDDVKLTKLDQNSEITIQKEGKSLEIEVKSGSLFFNVTQPLADDETMNIAASTMLVGIRGTCGWVENLGSVTRVYLLEGKVECSAEGQTVTVSAGEMAELTADGKLTVKEFTEQDLPAFVRDKVDNGPDKAPGLDGSDTPDEQDELNEEEAGELVASGDLGDTITWFLRGNTLFVRGTGEIQAPVLIDNRYTDFTSYPWYNYHEQIHTLVIGNGITELGNNAFYECSNLTSVTIPTSVTTMSRFIFSNCDTVFITVAVRVSGGKLSLET